MGMIKMIVVVEVVNEEGLEAEVVVEAATKFRHKISLINLTQAEVGVDLEVEVEGVNHMRKQ